MTRYVNWYNAPKGTTHAPYHWCLWWYQQSSDNPNDFALVYKNQYEMESYKWEFDSFVTNAMLSSSTFIVIPSAIPDWSTAPYNKTQIYWEVKGRRFVRESSTDPTDGISYFVSIWNGWSIHDFLDNSELKDYTKFIPKP